MHPDDYPERIFANDIKPDGLRVNGPYPSLTEGNPDDVTGPAFAWRQEGGNS
jgi:hypothetical protein